jgi:D-alanyl-D-alanine carboxypeptidase/D-alanyl-D-alanine-endopeptidase (penicillin-binding protein 4)
MRARLSILLAVLAAALAVAPAAESTTQDALDRAVAREMARIGPHAGVLVRDLDAGSDLYARRADVPRPPASVEKLYTTSTALLRFGPNATFTTTVLGAGGLDATGVWRGDLILRGGGDPTLSTWGVAQLALRLRAAGIRRVAGRLLGDESLFDRLRGSAETRGRYDRWIGGVLGALTVGRGWSRDGSPAAEGARRLARALKARGVKVTGGARAGLTPIGARPLTTLASPTVAALVRLTLVPSDNFLAETLLKDLGASFGGAGTTAAGVGVVRAQAAAFGLRPAIVDGSGLSRADRTSPRQVVGLLAAMHARPLGPAFEGALAVAGRTGTIARRMRRTAAQDRCHAKTGTLIGVSALAGVCRAIGGHAIAFAVLTTGSTLWRAHRAQDRIAALAARYDGP